MIIIKFLLHFYADLQNALVFKPFRNPRKPPSPHKAANAAALCAAAILRGFPGGLAPREKVQEVTPPGKGSRGAKPIGKEFRGSKPLGKIYFFQ